MGAKISMTEGRLVTDEQTAAEMEDFGMVNYLTPNIPTWSATRWR
jgi:hypothetical protein